MARRLLTFVLAFVVIGVPLAGDFCEVVCAEHAGHAMDSVASAAHHHNLDGRPSHHHHSDAPPAPVTQNAAFKTLPHPCSHLEAVVTESREFTQAPIVKAIVATAGIAPLLLQVFPTSEMDCRHGPPTRTPSISPLRI